MANEDPFTEVLKALWTLLETNNDFNSLVQIGNRVKLWSGNVKPDVIDEEGELSINDLPLVIIEPAGGSMNPSATSTGGNIVQRYRIRMIDGNLLLHKSYNNSYVFYS